jgi:hypothetical protein
VPAKLLLYPACHNRLSSRYPQRHSTMLETRLIFVEGLAGSGKSSTARHLVAQLAQARLAARLFSEHQQDHPLNVGGPFHPAGTTTGEELLRRYTVEAYVAESLERWRAFVAMAAAVETVSVLDSYPYQNSSANVGKSRERAKRGAVPPSSRAIQEAESQKVTSAAPDQGSVSHAIPSWSASRRCLSIAGPPAAMKNA